MTGVRYKWIKLIQVQAGALKDRRKGLRALALADRSTTNCTACEQHGLTLLELLIVIGIIGILSAIAVPFYFGQIEKARVIKAVAELDNLQFEIQNFELDYDRLPESLEEVKSGGLADPWGNSYRYLNFETIEEASTPENQPRGRAQGRARNQGTARGRGRNNGANVESQIRLDQLGDSLNSDYDLYSCGKDGASAPSIDDPLSLDDVVRGRDGAYIGPVSQFEP